MKLFILSQSINNEYDTYDSCVVCAIDEADAKTIRPDGNPCLEEEEKDYDSWCGIGDVSCEYIGIAKAGLERGVILSSFNAG